MIALITASVVSTPPPALGIPSFIDGWKGWLAGIAVLLVPSVLLAIRSHTILGHWLRYFAQWRKSSWWLVIGGSITLAIGVFSLLGALPAWNQHWKLWSQDAMNQIAPDSNPVVWINQTQQQYAQVLQICAILSVAIGIVVVLLGMWRFSRTVLVRRQAVAPKTQWMMSGEAMRHPDDSMFTTR